MTGERVVDDADDDGWLVVVVDDGNLGERNLRKKMG